RTQHVGGVARAQIRHADAPACDLVLVRGADALPGGSDPRGAAALLADEVQALVVLEEQVRASADADAAPGVDAARVQRVQLLEELLHVEHDAVAEQAALPRMQDAGWDLVQDELVAAHVHGVAGVRAALVPCDDVHRWCEHVHDLALALVAPLGADDHETPVVLEHACVPLQVDAQVATARRTKAPPEAREAGPAAPDRPRTLAARRAARNRRARPGGIAAA